MEGRCGGGNVLEIYTICNPLVSGVVTGVPVCYILQEFRYFNRNSGIWTF